ncbi:MAG: M48 family metallopeptidase [Rhodospirillales bacterium]|nr:M48 family metallopeptidase [Rhodospirillales bacterium]
MIFRSSFLVALIVIGTLIVNTPGANAQRLSFIRDAEIENTIRAYATPLFRAARLEPSAIKIYIVKDRSLNAFVAGGQNLFINSGLIMRAKSAEQIIGVIAHETGHIAGGHLSRSVDALNNLSAQTILGVLMGGAALLGGRPDVGAAIMGGAQNAATRSYLGFSRVQESAADRAAVKYLDATNQTSRGLLEFLELLGEQELLSTNRQDPYVRTHPLTRDRVSFLENHVKTSRYINAPVRDIFQIAHARMVAKLRGYTESLAITLRHYPLSDQSSPARYARAVGYYRSSQYDNAVQNINSLISEQPNDPYFHELKGQILFENRHGAEAINSYERAVALLPNSSLILTDLARAQIEQNDPELRIRAVKHLRAALEIEPKRPFAWRQLAIALGQMGNMSESWHALAEEALLIGKFDDAIRLAKKSQAGLKVGTPAWLRSEDITAAATESKKGR